MNTINAVIVIDDGPQSAQAVERISAVLADHLDRVLLLHVIPGSPFYGKGLPVWDEWDDLATEYARSQKLLERTAHDLQARGVLARISTECVVGDPMEMVPLAAAEMGADVIILGTPLGTMGRERPACTSRQAPAAGADRGGTVEERALAAV